MQNLRLFHEGDLPSMKYNDWALIIYLYLSDIELIIYFFTILHVNCENLNEHRKIKTNRYYAQSHSYRGAKDRGILLNILSVVFLQRNFPLNVKNRNIIEIKVKNDIHLLERKISDLQIIP